MGEGSGLRVQGSGFWVDDHGGGAIALAESRPSCVHLEALLIDR